MKLGLVAPWAQQVTPRAHCSLARSKKERTGTAQFLLLENQPPASLLLLCCHHRAAPARAEQVGARQCFSCPHLHEEAGLECFTTPFFNTQVPRARTAA